MKNPCNAKNMTTVTMNSTPGRGRDHHGKESMNTGDATAGNALNIGRAKKEQRRRQAIGGRGSGKGIREFAQEMEQRRRANTRGTARTGPEIREEKQSRQSCLTQPETSAGIDLHECLSFEMRFSGEHVACTKVHH